MPGANKTLTEEHRPLRRLLIRLCIQLLPLDVVKLQGVGTCPPFVYTRAGGGSCSSPLASRHDGSGEMSFKIIPGFSGRKVTIIQGDEKFLSLIHFFTEKHFLATWWNFWMS